MIYFIHSPVNVTELYKLREREKAGLEVIKNQRQQLYSTFMQAPVGIAIFKGDHYVVDLINPLLCQLYGKTHGELMGLAWMAGIFAGSLGKNLAQANFL